MKNLIINLGPGGDIVRNTFLHNMLEGEIYWLSSRKFKDLLQSKKIDRIFYKESEEDVEDLKDVEFDMIISLNEEKEALEIVKSLQTKRLEGVFLDTNGNIDYTKNSSEWFDMSLSSKFGKEKADELKKNNKKTYQELISAFLEKKWSGEKYDLGVPTKKTPEKRIGMINVVKGLWPNKAWSGYDALKEKLNAEGYDVEYLGMRETIREHIEDINNCTLIVCGDTMGTHIALALEKKVVALFNCTSPSEIADYGLMEKIVSPLYEDYFYKKTEDPKVQQSISLETVYQRVKSLLNQN